MEKCVSPLVLINSACSRFGIPTSRFGREAINDPNLVDGLRQGRVLRPSTAEAIVAYIATLDTSTPREVVRQINRRPRTRPKCVQLPAELTFAEHCMMMRSGSAKLLSAILAAKGEC